MSHEESKAWRPKGADETFNGFDVWDHGVFPTDVNCGEVDGEIDLCDDE